MEDNSKKGFPAGPSDNTDDYLISEGFKISEDQSEAEQLQNKISGSKKKKRKFPVKNVIWILSIIIVSVGLAFGIIYAGADFMGIGFGRGDDCEMEIEAGTPASEIAEQLKEEGAVKIPALFRLYAKLKGYDSQFKYGLYTFNTEAGYDSICEMLMTEGAKAETVQVTIPEGTGINDYTKNVNGEDVTVKGIATILEEKGVCSKSDFFIALDEVNLKTRLLSGTNEGKTYYTLEGYLFPETYSFYSYDDSAECARLAVKRMIEETESRITDEMYEQAENLGYSMNEILTMASIVQMEAGEHTDEMAKVAGVFYNRLNSDDIKTLGSSPTCYYGDSFKYDDGRYNTYDIEGLPPGPLCSPGIDAIKAALYPEKSDYYYFVTDSKGNFYYHKTLAEQEKTINKLQSNNEWIYEYFD